MVTEAPTFTMEPATLIYRNFAGRATPYKEAGQKTFCLVLPPDFAEELARDGWNVKCKDTEEAGERTCHIEVGVRFDVFAPRIILVTSRGATKLDNETVDQLDYADIETASVVIRAYDWNMPGGKSGRKAYLRSLFVTIHEDDLERKYAHLIDEANAAAPDPNAVEIENDPNDPEADLDD